jgi:hypothetical protein
MVQLGQLEVSIRRTEFVGVKLRFGPKPYHPSLKFQTREVDEVARSNRMVLSESERAVPGEPR